MQLIIHPGGMVRCLYAETIDLPSLGPLSIERAAHVDPTETGNWVADLSPTRGPVLGPFAKRSQALAEEADWLNRHLLDEPRAVPS